MTSLAQTFIDRADDGLKFAEEVNDQNLTAYRVVLNRLMGSCLWAKPPAIVDIRAAQQSAERFIFHDDLTHLAEHLPADIHVRRTMARLPCEVIWVEWPVINDDAPSHCVRMGALLDNFVHRFHPGEWRNQPHTAVFICGVAEDNPPRVLQTLMLPTSFFTSIDGQFTLVHDMSMAEGDGTEASARRGAGHVMAQIVDALFLLNVPRVSELRESTPSVKLQKARSRRGKMPLLELKHVKLMIGQGGVRYANGGRGLARLPGETDEEHRKRLHQVIGHFRTYTKKRETPKISWVPPHWRGDASKGIVLHERTIIGGKV